MAISGIVSSSSREVPYAPASVSGSDVGTARAYNDASATISFTAPVHDGGLPVTGYTVTSTPGGLTASGSSSPLTITGLSSSVNYTYGVTATNSIGTGPSLSSGSVFATTIPQPATIGTATATGAAGTVSVGFTANGTGGKTVTYTATSSPGGFTGSSSSSPVSVSGLSNGTAYTFTVVASNANGSAAASSASNSATPYTYVPPAGPIGSTTPSASASGATVTSSSGAWGAGTTPTSYTYNLYRSDGTYIATSGSVPTSTTSVSFAASYSTSYYVTVTASNSNGSGTMTSNTVTTGAEPPPLVTPSAPRSLYVTANSSATGGVYGFSAPASGTFPMTVYYSLIQQEAGGSPVANGSVTFYSSGESSNVFSRSDNGNYALEAYAYNGLTGPSARTPSSGYTAFAYTPCTTPGSMSGLVSASYNTTTKEITWSWSAPSQAGSYYQYSINGGPWYTQLATTVTSSSDYNTSNTIQVYNSNFCNGVWYDGGVGSSSIYTPSNPTVAPGSMAGLVSGSYSGGYCNFSWSAPTGTAPFTYYYNFGGTTYNTTGTSAYVYAEAATITVYASNNAGAGLNGSASASAPAPVQKWLCTTSVQCAGVGNCSYNEYTTATYSSSGTGYSITCTGPTTNTLYPSCQSTAGATCTGNLGCCSQGLKYRCSDYDVNNSASVNYYQCYTIGDCDANYDPAGVRTRCCPTEC